MALLDAMAQITTATAFDLSTVSPGAGNPLFLFVVDADANGDMTVTQGATSAAADDCMVVTLTAGEQEIFALPSNVARYIKMTIPAGAAVYVVPHGNVQSNT